MTLNATALAIVPGAVVAAFAVHWASLRTVGSAEERLPLCRGAYLGLSAQIVAYSWALYAVLAAELGASGGAPGEPAGPGLRGFFLVAVGASVSMVGDFFNLQFPSAAKRVKEPLFFGILSFAVAQSFYMAGFLTITPLGVLARDGGLLITLAVLVIVPAILFRFGVWNPKRPRSVMYGAFGYGFFLGAMAAIALSAALAYGGAWIVVAVGAGLFLLSDAVMGQTTIKGVHPKAEFQIPWITYLAAQGLIVLGSFLAGAAA